MIFTRGESMPYPDVFNCSSPARLFTPEVQVLDRTDPMAANPLFSGAGAGDDPWSHFYEVSWASSFTADACSAPNKISLHVKRSEEGSMGADCWAPRQHVLNAVTARGINLLRSQRRVRVPFPTVYLKKRDRHRHQ